MMTGTAVTEAEEFYKIYPSHKARVVAEASWLKLNPSEELVKIIMADVSKRKTSDRSWLAGYVPMPATYLNLHTYLRRLVGM